MSNVSYVSRTRLSGTQVQTMKAPPHTKPPRKSHFHSGGGKLCAAVWSLARHTMSVPAPKPAIQTTGKIAFITKVCAEERVRAIGAFSNPSPPLLPCEDTRCTRV